MGQLHFIVIDSEVFASTEYFNGKKVTHLTAVRRNEMKALSHISIDDRRKMISQ